MMQSSTHLLPAAGLRMDLLLLAIEGVSCEDVGSEMVEKCELPCSSAVEVRCVRPGCCEAIPSVVLSETVEYAVTSNSQPASAIFASVLIMSP